MFSQRQSNVSEVSNRINQSRLVSFVTFGEKAFARYKPRQFRGAARNTSGIGLHLRTSPLNKLTKYIKETYRNANKEFYFQERVPKRVLTQPCELDVNSEWDNEEGNLICYVNDTLESPSIKYVILDLLGQGTFGQVFRCQDPMTKNMVAVKVIKNRPAFHNQAKLEIHILRYLRERVDPHNKKHLVRLLDYFDFKHHICMVFELLSINIYELLKQNNFRGLPLPIIQLFITQMLESLAALESANVMHCDLKPENILLVAKDRSDSQADHDMEPSNKKRGKPRNEVKLIDFGSACFEGNAMYTYIQSRFYRSPEVLLGLDYDGAIDAWSLGCICAEMFLGLPLFPGTSDHDQLLRIVEMVGAPTDWMVEQGREGPKFFHEVDRCGRPVSPDTLEIQMLGSLAKGTTPEPGSKFKIKTPDEFARDTKTELKPRKKWFKFEKLQEILESYPYTKQLSAEELQLAEEARRIYIHFVQGFLQIDPWKRWTARQGLSHPFITGKKIPPGGEIALDMSFDPKIENRRKLWERKQANPGIQYQPMNSSDPPTMDRSFSFTQLNQMYGAMQVATDSDHPISPSSGHSLSQGGFSLGTLLNQQSSSLGTSLNQSSFLAGSMHDPRDSFMKGPASRPFGGQEPMVAVLPGQSNMVFLNHSDPQHSPHHYVMPHHSQGHSSEMLQSSMVGNTNNAQGLHRSRDMSDSVPGWPSDPEGWPMALEEQQKDQQQGGVFTFDDPYNQGKPLQSAGLMKANSFGSFGQGTDTFGTHPHSKHSLPGSASQFHMPVRDFSIGNNGSKTVPLSRRRGRNSSFTDSRTLANTALSPRDRIRRGSSGQQTQYQSQMNSNYMFPGAELGGPGPTAFVSPRSSSYDTPPQNNGGAAPFKMEHPPPTHPPLMGALPSAVPMGGEGSTKARGDVPVAAWDPYFEEAFGDNLMEMEFSTNDTSRRC